MSAITITGGRVLTGATFAATEVPIADGVIGALGGAVTGRRLDASGLYVLPGIVDVHGDAFERQLMPRPGVAVALDVALIETDRQIVANGITTAYHGVTWSWEGGLRGPGTAAAILGALARLERRLSADTRYHLRHEIYNFDAEPTILGWLAERRIDCIAFNDHMSGTIKDRHRPKKLAKMIERSGLSDEDFHALTDRLWARGAEVRPMIERLAAVARTAGVPMLSHDDMTPEMRGWYRGIGCTVAEFPVDEVTTAAAGAAGDPIVFGAPNVMRGGSHTGCPNAAEMAARGLCTALASDYYYPALPLAPFKLAAERGIPLERAWDLVSAGPAAALALADRGRIEPGLRADIVLVDADPAHPPHVVATIVAGRLVHLADATRLH